MASTTAHAQITAKEPHTPQSTGVGIEDLTVPIPMIVGAFVVIVGAVGGAMIWLGRLQQRLTEAEHDMGEVKEALEDIKESLDSLGKHIESRNKELEKEILREIKKQTLQSEGNIDSSFQPTLIKITLQLDYLAKKLGERDQTLSQIKTAIGRIGTEAREAKSLSKLVWDMQCSNGPPSKPHNYGS